MSAEPEPQENNDSENENLGENSEENSEVDIDHGNDIEDELSYEEKLEKYFEEVEKGFGIDQANKIRKKINASKELSMLLDSMEFEGEYRSKLFEFMQKMEDDSQILQEQALKCIEKSMESIAKNDELSKNFFERALKSLDASDKRDEQLGELVKQLAIKIDARSKERHELKMQFLKVQKTEVD
jgi:hypothetical protein